MLEAEGSTYESDVYSFGIVAWEVISTKFPWADKIRPRDVICAVLKGLRPVIPAGAPVDIADVMKACWAEEPEARPEFGAIMEGLKLNGWKE